MAAFPVVDNQRDFALAEDPELVRFLKQAILALIQRDLSKDGSQG